MILPIFWKLILNPRAYSFTQEPEILIYMGKHIIQPQCQNDLEQVSGIKIKYNGLSFSKSYLIFKNNYFSMKKN